MILGGGRESFELAAIHSSKETACRPLRTESRELVSKLPMATGLEILHTIVAVLFMSWPA